MAVVVAAVPPNPPPALPKTFEGAAAAMGVGFPKMLASGEGAAGAGMAAGVAAAVATGATRELPTFPKTVARPPPLPPKFTAAGVAAAVVAVEPNRELLVLLGAANIALLANIGCSAIIIPCDEDTAAAVLVTALLAPLLGQPKLGIGVVVVVVPAADPKRNGFGAADGAGVVSAFFSPPPKLNSSGFDVATAAGALLTTVLLVELAAVLVLTAEAPKIELTLVLTVPRAAAGGWPKKKLPAATGVDTVFAA